MSLRGLLPALVLTGALAACAGLRGPMPGEAAKPILSPARAAISDYLLTGRIAATHGQQRYAVNFTWQHSAVRDEIFLTTPLGQGIAELTRDSAGARLTTAERREFRAPDWHELAVQVFGLALPLSALPRWLLANVPAQALRVSYDRFGRPQQMLVDDWQVTYLEYASDAVDALPALVELKREGVEAIEVRFKLDEWELPQ